MSAKIKKPAKHLSGSPRPRGVARNEYRKVYWPFIPVVFAFAALLALGIKSGTITHVAKHPFSKVLSYSTSENVGSMLAETNLYREQFGELDLKLSSVLSKAASTKAADMAARDYWSHNTPDGTPPWTFVTAAGYAYQKVGENLATGFYNEEEAIKGWMASPAHRENMLDPSFSEVGFGFAKAAHYSAVGGGPTTVFVAYYARPANSQIVLAGRPLSTLRAPSTTNHLVHKTRNTAPIYLAFSQSQWGTWAPVGMALLLVGIFTILGIKHVRLISRTLRRTEYYVWHHPAFDVSLLLLAALTIILWQTIGLVR